jgi:hypothetical protein
MGGYGRFVKNLCEVVHTRFFYFEPVPLPTSALDRAASTEPALPEDSLLTWMEIRRSLYAP